MREREIFRLIVRTVGVALIAFGVSDAVGSLLTYLKFQTDRYYTAADRASAALAYLLSGLLILLAADLLTRVVYRADKGSN